MITLSFNVPYVSKVVTKGCIWSSKELNLSLKKVCCLIQMFDRKPTDNSVIVHSELSVIQARAKPHQMSCSDL